MWEILITLTEESRQEVLSKCAELEFDTGACIVSLDESLINLSLACEILKDAIEKEKLIQMPITIQETLFSYLQDIAGYQDKLINGANEVENLSEAIEKLNTYIWQFGLFKLSDEVLGYEKKMNQLKGMLLEASKVTKELKAGLKVKSSLEKILAEAENHQIVLQNHVTETEAAEAKATHALEGIATQVSNAAVLRDAMQERHDMIIQSQKDANTSLDEISTMEESINVHLVGFNDSSLELEKHKVEQQTLFDEFVSYRETINGLLVDANRAGMASAFEKRKEELVTPMYVWLVVFAISLFGLIFMGFNYLVPLFDSGNLAQLPFRTVLTAPLVWLGWFSAKQYGYTSRLREDYAYKAASAMSFEGYKREANAVSPEMLKNLLETAIKNLGENPIRIYNGRGHHASPLHEMLESLPKDTKIIDLLKMLKREQ